MSSKGASTSTGRGVLSVLKVPTQIETDATTKLQSILERDDRARISFIKDTLPAFAVSVKDALVAVLPFRRPEPERAGLSNTLYLWDADMEED